MKLRSQDEGPPALNLTPMVDVVFLLIIFFLVATTFYRAELEMAVDLPESTEADTVFEPAGELVVNVFADGTIVVEGKAVDLDQLGRRLVEAAQADPDRTVIIRGDSDARHKGIVQVMDACAGSGITHVSIGVAPSHNLGEAEGE